MLRDETAQYASFLGSRALLLLHQVQELQQGAPLQAPLEVRLSGEDIVTLRQLADRVEGILRGTAGAIYVDTDWRQTPTASR